MSGNGGQINHVEEQVESLLRRFAGGENIVSMGDMEKYHTTQREIIMRDINMAMRRIDGPPPYSLRSY
jgi:hypothetical protein